ncbi:hypothetical protein [Paeniglutamicibacter cryotolerans]|uniref:Uncharacterized protein n=1 Tax=Paeniglutamicibacter cryotolerans TaxID=670079 RepID=A0A839QR29_9MICC|nr:hypothetical protein [Paeniglutamicibacter cryotolerans]MBB2996446.1 hypothetical protein [Paeniglutamicibacter cryotolerans]
MPERGKWPTVGSGFRGLRMIAAALAMVGLLAGATPAVATAAPAKSAVSVGVIATKSVAPGKKTTIKPVLVKRGTVRIASSTLSVTRSKKSVAKNKKSVSLAAGSYVVKTRVTYQLKSGSKWARAKTATKSQKLIIKTAKASAKVNTVAGKKELVSRINAKRKSNGLKPLTLVHEDVLPPVEQFLHSAGDSLTWPYFFEGSHWPTAKEWLEVWYAHDYQVKRLLKNKKAASITMVNAVAHEVNHGLTLNVLDIDLYQGTKGAVRFKKGTRLGQELGPAGSRDRIVGALQQVRAAAKLPPLKVGKGEPVLKKGEKSGGSIGTGRTGRFSLRDVLVDEHSGVMRYAMDKKYTHLMVSFKKQGSGYRSSLTFYQIARS